MSDHSHVPHLLTPTLGSKVGELTKPGHGVRTPYSQSLNSSNSLCFTLVVGEKTFAVNAWRFWHWWTENGRYLQMRKRGELQVSSPTRTLVKPPRHFPPRSILTPPSLSSLPLSSPILPPRPNHPPPPQISKWHPESTSPP